MTHLTILCKEFQQLDEASPRIILTLILKKKVRDLQEKVDKAILVQFL